MLREQAAENDTGPEAQRGVNIVLRLVPIGQIAPPSVPVAPAEGAGSPAAAGGAAPPAGGAPAAPAAPGAPARGRPGAPPVVAPVTGPAGARITVTLDNIPLGEALRYVAAQAGLKVKVEPYAVSLIPLSEQSNDLITKRYHVPPEFFGGPLDVGYYIGSNVTGGGGQTAGATTGVREAPPVATDVIEKEAVSFQTASGTGTGAGASSQANLLQGTASTRQTLLNDRQLVGRADAITMLKSMGVSFPPGASATFWPHSGTLIVRNTQDNLDMVDALVDQANSSAPKQVSIESKFVEINQNNLKELGFDWLLGPFSLNGKVFGSGGTGGNGVPVNAANFPFNNNGIPVGGPGTGRVQLTRCDRFTVPEAAMPCRQIRRTGLLAALAGLLAVPAAPAQPPATQPTTPPPADTGVEVYRKTLRSTVWVHSARRRASPGPLPPTPRGASCCGNGPCRRTSSWCAPPGRWRRRAGSSCACAACTI